jgi:hypothetical protein
MLGDVRALSKRGVRGQRVEGCVGGGCESAGRLALVQRVEVAAWHLSFVRHLHIDVRPGDIRIFV